MGYWFDWAWNSVAAHLDFYVRFVQDQWAHMSPPKYTALLVSISLAGVLLMGRDRKR